MLGMGLCLARNLSGLEREMNKKQAAKSSPESTTLTLLSMPANITLDSGLGIGEFHPIEVEYTLAVIGMIAMLTTTYIVYHTCKLAPMHSTPVS